MFNKILTVCIIAAVINLPAIGSQLSFVEENNKIEDTDLPLQRSVESKRKIYYREKEQVAVIIDRVTKIANLAPQKERILLFMLPNKSWAKIKLNDRRFYTVNGIGLYVTASDGSISVVSEGLNYFETFFFDGEGKFLDGEERDNLKPEFFKMAREALPN